MPRKATNLAWVVYAAAFLVMVLLGTPNPPSLPVRLVQAHVHATPKRGPAGSTSCRHHGCPSSGGRWRSCGQRAAGARFGSRMWPYVAVEILQPGRLAKGDELVVDEAILDVVELVNVLHNCLTLVL